MTTSRIVLPKQFSERRNLLAAVYVIANLAVVMGAGLVAYYVDHWAVYVLAFVLVGARGQACYILQHEAMHNLLFSSRSLNERAGVLLSALLGTQFYIGRAGHMKHHQDVGSPSDPNEYFHRTEGKRPIVAFLRFFGFQLLGGRIVLVASGVARPLLTAVGLRSLAARLPSLLSDVVLNVTASQRKVDLAALAGMQLVMLVMFAVFAQWWVYFALYALPLATLTAFFESIRSFSEHVVPGTPRSEAELHRRFYMNSGAIENFFISQFGFNYHHVHHLYTNIPTFNVKQAHEWLTESMPNFQDLYEERPGYIGTALLYLREQPFPGYGEQPATAAAAHA